MKKLIVFSLTLSLFVSLSSCVIYNDKPKTTAVHNPLEGESTENEADTQSILQETEAHTLINDTEEYNLLKTRADEIINSHSAIGVQIAVLKDGKLYYTYEYGFQNAENKLPVAPDTKFRVASLSKLVTDTIFMALCDEGKASLDADISDYFGFTVRNPHFPDVALTPAMLMSHTSGMVDSSAFLNSRLSGSSTPIKTLLSDSGSYSYNKPGTYYNYCNFGVSLISCISELITGTCFEELAKKYVFDPLGIDAAYTASAISDKSLIADLYGHGGYTVDQQLALSWNEALGQSHHLAQGNLTISAKDYMKIAAILSNGGVSADGIRLISEESAAELLKVRYESDSFKTCFGLLKQTNVIDGIELCVHTGSNFGMFAAFALDPVTGNGVTVLTSGADGSKDTTTDVYNICLDLIRELFPQ